MVERFIIFNYQLSIISHQLFNFSHQLSVINELVNALAQG